MKAKQIEDILDALKSLRKKVKKSAQAQAKVEDKLAQVEALVNTLFHQADADSGKKSKKAIKQKTKKAKPTLAVNEEATHLVHPAP